MNNEFLTGILKKIQISGRILLKSCPHENSLLATLNKRIIILSKNYTNLSIKGTGFGTLFLIPFIEIK